MLRAIGIRVKALDAFPKLIVIFIAMAMLGEVYLRSSAPAAMALAFTEHNAAVQSAVGGVEDARLNWIGSIHYDGNDGWASLAMHVTGARTNGTIDVTLQRQHGEWKVSSGRLRTDSGRVIEIAESAKPVQVCAAN